MTLTNMLVEMWPIEKPIEYARNARKITQAAVDKVAASIQEFGFRQPIVVDNDGVIIVGHVRLRAAKKLGLTEVPVHVAANLTPAQVKAYRLMDNRSHEEVEWDIEMLGAELLELRDLDIEMLLTGFNPRELDTLLRDPAVEEKADQAPPLPLVAVTQPGDLWLCGPHHRVLCGDATAPVDVERLMAGDAADLVFTDPPYNVDYEGYTEEKLQIKGDRMSDVEFKQFLEGSFRSYRTVVKPGTSLYVCHASSCQREFQNALETTGFEVRCQIIWAKNTFAWGFGRYKFQHEPLFYAHVDGEKDPWYGDKSQSTLWQENKPAADRLHPTMKPVELIERALLNSSKAGDVVADLFGGSGSTLIACERRNRKARLMEIDPKYADCIVRRFQEYTGKQAFLEGDGRTFDEIVQERTKEAA